MRVDDLPVEKKKLYDMAMENYSETAKADLENAVAEAEDWEEAQCNVFNSMQAIIDEARTVQDLLGG